MSNNRPWNGYASSNTDQIAEREEIKITKGGTLVLKMDVTSEDRFMTI